MPTYAYACTACDHAFDFVQSFSDDPLSVCPECGGRLRKVYGSIGVTFKGSGFYRNDSRAAGSKAGGSAGSAGPTGAGDSKEPGGSGSSNGNGSKSGADTSSSAGSSGASGSSGSGSSGSSLSGGVQLGWFQGGVVGHVLHVAAGLSPGFRWVVPQSPAGRGAEA
ncbi:MAG: FmdB family transcriptional regulator [Actinomycetales bacterium]|nr:FmdB family transcriptional regulator [Actinomycetales bacterium]